MPWADSGISRVRVLPEYREPSVASIDSPGRLVGSVGNWVAKFGAHC